MLTVRFFSFSKRTNSTKRPTGDAVVSFNCVLLAPTSIKNPVLQLGKGQELSPYSWNYCYIQEFDRYYFVYDWSWNSGLWTVTTSGDVLATFKNEIGASTQYVLRSSYRFNGMIEDGYYPATCDRSFSYVSASGNLFGLDWDGVHTSAGAYVVGVAGSTTAYLIFTPDGFHDFMAELMSNEYLDSVLGAGEHLTHPEFKMQLNPIQYIKSVVYYTIPFGSSTGELITQDFVVGYGTIRRSVIRGDIKAVGALGFTLYRTTLSTATLIHPQASRGEYLNRAPYTNYVVYVPGFGYVQVDSKTARDFGEMTFEITVNPGSGVGELVIYCGARIILAKAEAQIGSQIQVSQVLSSGYGVAAVATDLFGFASTVVSGASAASGSATPFKRPFISEDTGRLVPGQRGSVNAMSLVSAGVDTVSGAVASLNSSVENSLRGRVAVCNTVGSNSPGVDKLRGNIFIIAEFNHIVSEDNSDLGRPLCETVRIDTIPGLVVCMHTDINLPTTPDEIEAVKSFMNGGFFYE